MVGANCRGFVTADVLGKDLVLEPSHLGGDSKGLSGKDTAIYPGSAPREEVKAYVLLCVVLMEFRLQGRRNSPDLALDDF